MNGGDSTIDDEGRPEPPLAADEVATLLGFLDFQRATLEWRCRDLDADGLSAGLHPTTMTLGGLLNHMAWVEDHWFSRRLHGNDPIEPWASADWESDRDWEWRSAAGTAPGVLRARWATAVERSRVLTAEALASGGLDQMARVPWSDGATPSLRWILVHMIEEYARHNGHADLLREAIDGQTGE